MLTSCRGEERPGETVLSYLTHSALLLGPGGEFAEPDQKTLVLPAVRIHCGLKRFSSQAVE